jgi:hypothetical protein
MSSIHDLLPIPTGMQTPNAYHVFGLESGEQDMDKITAKVVAVIEQLKLVKEQSDPGLWQQAAKMVDQSRKILADPKRKSALDATLPQVSNQTVPKQLPNSSGDPLAGLLPSGDPLLLSGDRLLLSGAPLFPVTKIQQEMRTVDRSSKRRQSRRRTSTGNWILGLMILALVAVVCLLGYFVFLRQGKIEIVKTGDKITISTEAQGSYRAVESVASSPVPDRPVPDRPVPDRPVPDPPETIDLATATPPESVPTDRILESDHPSEVTTAPEMTRVAPPTDVRMLDQSKQQEELEQVRQLIRKSDWKNMKSAAESLTEQNLSPQNQLDAQRLSELADLATHYRGGIERAVSELQAGHEIVINDSLFLQVAKKADDLLIVRSSKEQKWSFSFDEFPFSLAHKLASFQVSESPTGLAAKAVYQAIAPKATEANREESIQWLTAISDEIEGADRDRLVQAIQSIYPSEQE